jgi:hypothetical protein
MLHRLHRLVSEPRRGSLVDRTLVCLHTLSELTPSRISEHTYINESIVAHVCVHARPTSGMESRRAEGGRRESVLRPLD